MELIKTVIFSKYLLFSATLVLFACNNHEPETADKKTAIPLPIPANSVQESANFASIEVFFADFQKNLNLSKKKGLWIIHNAYGGTMPSIIYTSQHKPLDSLYLKIGETYHFKTNLTFDSTHIQNSVWPKINCETGNGAYTNEGVFIIKENTLQKLSQYLQFEDDSEVLKNDFLKTLSPTNPSNISYYSVLATNTNLKLYFQLKGADLKLIAIDLRNPCEA